MSENFEQIVEYILKNSADSKEELMAVLGTKYNITKKKKKRDPNAPKAQKTAFLLFSAAASA